MSVPLLRYDRACRAIAEAKAVDEIVLIRDRADAMRAAAKIAGNRQVEIDMSEIRFRAERGIGGMMAEQRETIGLARGAQKTAPGVVLPDVPRLEDVNIDKHLADRARKYAAIPDDEFEALLAKRRGLIERENARITVDLIAAGDKAERRAAREAELARKICALPDKRYGVILDDPEWRFEVRSRETGLDRAADNHYPTSALEDIAARDVEMIAAIAAADCAWFRWVTVPFLAHGLRMMEIDGFVYKTSWAWDKVHIAKGYWNRNRHEILLLATRGNVPCPVQGTQWDSLFVEKSTDHSVKPEHSLAMIEAYFPNVPKIEMNRRGAARLGWDAWGNEAEPAIDQANPDQAEAA